MVKKMQAERESQADHWPPPALLWMSGLTAPMTVGASFLWAAHAHQAGWVWLVPALIYLVIPLGDWLVGVDRRNPTQAQKASLRAEAWSRWAVELFVPLQLTAVVSGAWLVSVMELPLWALLGAGIAVGSVNGVGFIASHELLHRRSRLAQWGARWALSPTLYGHFMAEHVRGHHKAVCTPPDPTSSRMGENYWYYLVRALVTGFQSAWHIEAQRLRKKGRSMWSLENENFLAWSASLLLFAGLILFFGAVILPYLLLQAIYGVILLEVTNYIEHYGMLRKKLSNGEYERFTHAHAWDSNHLVCSLFIYQLQRHADHHVNPNRPYHLLQSEPQTPQLPASYVTLMLVAYVPPLWFRLMNPMVIRHHGGDLSQANVDPRRREQMLALAARWRQA